MGFNLNHFRYWVVFLRVLVICNLNTSTVLADLNITVDDPETSIINYVPPGAWTPSAPTTLDFGGSHTLTSNPDATASFTFTGTAIYFLSPLWPYIVNTAISLDSGPSTLVDLTDHSRPNTNGGNETVQSQVVWEATGLANTRHNLLISVGAGQPYAIVDGLIYTSETTGISPSPSSAVSPTASLVVVSSTSTSPGPAITSPAGDTSSTKSNSSSVIAITLGSVLGALGLFIILLLLWWFIRRRQRKPPSSEPRMMSSPISNPSIMSSIRPNAMTNNYNGNWAGDQFDGNRYYMNPPNDGQNPHYEDVAIPPYPIPSHPQFHGGYYQDGTGSGPSMHQPQVIGRIANPYEMSYGITERLTPRMGDRKDPPKESSPSYQPTMPGSDSASQ